MLRFLLFATLLVCSNLSSDTSNQAIAGRKTSDDSLKAVIDQIPDIKPAIKTFTNVKKTLILLSDMGIGHMRPWHSDELGYMSSTPYYEFSAAGTGGLN